MGFDTLSSRRDLRRVICLNSCLSQDSVTGRLDRSTGVGGAIAPYKGSFSLAAKASRRGSFFGISVTNVALGSEKRVAGEKGTFDGMAHFYMTIRLTVTFFATQKNSEGEQGGPTAS